MARRLWVAAAQREHGRNTAQHSRTPRLHEHGLTITLQHPRRRWRRWRSAISWQTNVRIPHLVRNGIATGRKLTIIAALGSWADEMDAQPLPSAGSGYSARNAQRSGDSREEGRALNTSAWERTAGGVGGGSSSSGRVAGFGKTILRSGPPVNHCVLTTNS